MLFTFNRVQCSTMRYCWMTIKINKKKEEEGEEELVFMFMCVCVCVRASKNKNKNKPIPNFSFYLQFLSFIFGRAHVPPPNRYENLKGKYFELKRAELNGEQRPQWLYWKEMDYIVNQMPSNKLRTNLDHRILHLNNTSTNTTQNSSIEQNRSTASMAELRDTKPLRLNIQSQDSMGESALFTFSFCVHASV